MRFLTRDSVIWILFIIGGAAGYIVAHWSKFPWIGPDYQGLVEMVAALVTGIGLKLSTSPLGLSAEGKANEQIQQLGKPAPTQPPVLPPAA